MLGVYDYTVVLTYLGMLVSFTGITLALKGNAQPALLCLMVSGICDMFDGKVAATKPGRTRAEKRFGIQIDSLSDLVCFGMLPALIVYTASRESALSFLTGGFYLLCALIRLAWFNVDEEERQTETQGPREFYLGLPVTTSALILPAVMGMCFDRGWSPGVLGCVALAVMGAGFLTPFQVKKPARLGQIGVLACGGAGLLILLMGMR